MNKRYKKGYKAELEVRDILKREGNEVFRVAGSKPVDLIVLKLTPGGNILDVRVCEVKKFKSLKRAVSMFAVFLREGEKRFFFAYNLIFRFQGQWCRAGVDGGRVWCEPLVVGGGSQWCVCEFIRELDKRYKSLLGEGDVG